MRLERRYALSLEHGRREWDSSFSIAFPYRKFQTCRQPFEYLAKPIGLSGPLVDPMGGEYVLARESPFFKDWHFFTCGTRPISRRNSKFPLHARTGLLAPIRTADFGSGGIGYDGIVVYRCEHAKGVVNSGPDNRLDFQTKIQIDGRIRHLNSNNCKRTRGLLGHSPWVGKARTSTEHGLSFIDCQTIAIVRLRTDKATVNIANARTSSSPSGPSVFARAFC